MASLATPTLADIDALLRYLPALNQPGRSFVEWIGGSEPKDGHWTLPYPVYVADVVAFFEAVGQPVWRDAEYVPAQAFAMMQHDDFVARATLQQVKTMLTASMRCEAFEDGGWASLLEAGRVQALLWRLKDIREELTSSTV